MFKNTAKGFTLIEIVIVLVILISLASAFTFLGMRKLHESYRNAVEQVVSGIYQGIQNFYEDVGRYPNNLQELKQSTDPNWAGAYINYQLSGANQIDLAHGRIKVTYQKSFNGNTDCGYMNNRPAIIVRGYTDAQVQGLCKAVSGNTVYFVIPP
jgi:prepilin-type N-terminal cleavage/methylation domain-containing protein